MQNQSPIAKRMAFLVYDSRSGSTHLASLLDTHPEFCMSLESEFLLNAYRLYSGEPVTGMKLVRLVEEDRKLHDWEPGMRELALELIERNPDLDAEGLLEELFSRTLALKKSDSRWFALKQGLMADHVHRIVKRWPAAAIIHIRRDGRAVFNSKRKFKNIDTGLPMQSDPKKAARRWVKVMRSLDFLASGSRVIEVAFEALIRNQEKELGRVFTELGLDPQKARPENAGQYAGEIPANQRGLHPLVGSAPDSSRIDVWKTELKPRQIREYEAIAGPTLQRYGYPLTPKTFFGSLAGWLRPNRRQERRSPA